jgi:thiol-disulfide isomerase/thioredoxin
MKRIRRTPTLLAGALLLAAAVGGCSSSVGSSGDQGFVSGKGAITSLPPSERKMPGPVTGESLDGKPISLADYAGKVVVVNVWGSWCGPCRAEAPMLSAAARDMAKKGVAFLGINSRNVERSGPRGFVRRYDVPYPSIFDPDGRTLLSFRGTLAANAIPSTVIIDKQGRVAGSVLGEITRTTLDDLVHDAEKGGA